MKALYLLLFLALSTLPACSHTKSYGRHSRSHAKSIHASRSKGGHSKAYAKYIKRANKEREKRRVALAKQPAKLPSSNTMTPSGPQVTTSQSEGPQAVPRDSGNQ